MKDTVLKYKGYCGGIESDLENDVLYGEILFINDLVTYEADSLKELKVEFEAAVDDYLETCEQIGKEPQKSFSGSYNVRVGTDLHRDAALVAAGLGVKLNEFTKIAVKEKVDSCRGGDKRRIEGFIEDVKTAINHSLTISNVPSFGKVQSIVGEPPVHSWVSSDEQLFRGQHGRPN